MLEFTLVVGCARCVSSYLCFRTRARALHVETGEWFIIRAVCTLFPVILGFRSSNRIVDARAVGAHGGRLKRTSVCMNP